MACLTIILGLAYLLSLVSYFAMPSPKAVAQAVIEWTAAGGNQDWWHTQFKASTLRNLPRLTACGRKRATRSDGRVCGFECRSVGRRCLARGALAAPGGGGRVLLGIWVPVTTVLMFLPIGFAAGEVTHVRLFPDNAPLHGCGRICASGRRRSGGSFSVPIVDHRRTASPFRRTGAPTKAAGTDRCGARGGGARRWDRDGWVSGREVTLRARCATKFICSVNP